MNFNQPTTTAPSTGFGFNLQSQTPQTQLTFGGPAVGDAGATKPTLGGGLFGAPAANPVTGITTSTATLTFDVTTTTPASTSIAPLTSSLINPTARSTTLATGAKPPTSTDPAQTTQLTYNQLEEHINKWTLELEDLEKVFTEQATQINAWDKVLISNNQKIIELNDAVQKVKSDQLTLEQELEFIATQHTELEESIQPLQKEYMKIPQADIERSQTYLLAENLDTQLKQMSEDLKEIIDNLNESNKGMENIDPIMQIGRILNAHMNSLQWIETSSTEISNKLDDVSKMYDSLKHDAERSLRTAYYN